ncbi:MAG: adenine phosphoribosyltransferase [Lachnospiraceae bacterium]|nr:adenine phosphoribosyltransferase [Lachnospiraceae bacterium]
MKQLQDYITDIPDFPKEGIIFRDITTVLSDADGFRLAVDELKKLLEDIEFDLIAGAEARGFIFGAPLAYELGKPFILIRKKGKLPRETVSQTYDLEYGKAEIEIHKDDVKEGQKVVIIDDILATGGTLEASASLIENQGGKVVKILCLMELKGLKGRDKLKRYNVESVIAYEGA